MVKIIRGSRAPRPGFRGTPAGVGKLSEEQMIARVESGSPRLAATRSGQVQAELSGPELAATFPLVMQAAPNSSPVIGQAMQQRYRDALLSGQVNNPNLNRMIGMRDELRAAYQAAPSQQKQAIAMRGKALNMAIDQEVNRSAANMTRGSGVAQRTLVPVEDYYVPAAAQGAAPAMAVRTPGGGMAQAAQTLDDVLTDVSLQQSRVAPGTVESVYTGSKNYDPMQAGLSQEDILRYRQAVGLKGAQQANAQQRSQMYAMSEAEAMRNFDLGNRDNAIDTTASLSQRDVTRPDFFTEDTQQPLGMREAPPNYMMMREQYALAPVKSAPGEGQYIALAQTPTGVGLPVVPKGSEVLAPGVVLDPTQLGGSVGGGLPSAGLQYMTKINPQTGLNVVDTIMQGPGVSGPRNLIADRNQYIQPGYSVPLGAENLSTPGSLAFNRPLEPWAIPQMGTSGAGQYNNPRYSFENGVLMAQMPDDPMDIRPVNPQTGQVDNSLIAAMNQRTAASDDYSRAMQQVRAQYDFNAEPIRDELGYVIQPNNPDVMRNNPAGIGDPALIRSGTAAAQDALDKYIQADRTLRGTDMDITPYHAVARRMNVQGDNLQPESMMTPAITESLAGGMAANQARNVNGMSGGRDYGMLEPVMPAVNPNEGLAAMAQQAKLDVLNKQRATVGLPAINPNAPEGAAIVNAAIEADHLSRVRDRAKPLRDRAWEIQQGLDNSRINQIRQRNAAMQPVNQQVSMLQDGMNLDRASAVNLRNNLIGRGVMLEPGGSFQSGAYMESTRNPSEEGLLALQQAMTRGGVRF